MFICDFCDNTENNETAHLQILMIKPFDQMVTPILDEDTILFTKDIDCCQACSHKMQDRFGKITKTDFINPKDLR